MEKKKQNNLQNFKTAYQKKFAPLDLDIIKDLAFHRVFEPFEINFALNFIRETRVKMEQKINPVLQKFSVFSFKIRKKTSQSFTKLKQNLSQSTLLKKNSVLVHNFKKKHSHWEEKAKEVFFIQLDKALSLVFERKFETLIIQKSKSTCNLDLKNIIAIQKLSRTNRMLLLKNMYPFELTLTGKIKKTINQTSNILLGLVVVSNIPFTGATVNLITTFKSVIYLSNRLHLLSSIYGCPIICKEAGFTVATKIVSNIIDYESNPHHTPLHYSIVKDLYQYRSKSSLLEFLKKSTIKDIYISIPLVGSLSLAKITLDEQNITKLTLKLVQNYFDYQYLLQKYEKQILDQELALWEKIYYTQKKCGWVNRMLQKIVNKTKPAKNFAKDIFKSMQKFKKKEQVALENIHQKAIQIYNAWKQNPEKELEKIALEYCKNGI